MSTRATWILLAVAWLLLAATHGPVTGHESIPYIPHEQLRIEVREPHQLAPARLPPIQAPVTVDSLTTESNDVPLTLDEAIRIALANGQVVRVLTGVQATSTGRTIYDPAISVTSIDQAQARFDPVVQALQSFNRTESPQAVFDPADPTRAIIAGLRNDDYRLNTGINKTSPTGGSANFGVNTNPNRTQPGILPLNPRTPASAELSYTQPLLQGGGIAVNRVPIVLARIDTERSFFRLKDGVQDTVRSTVEGYWALVAARVDVWVREQQVAQTRAAYRQIDAQFRLGHISNGADRAQSALALANFEAALIASQANVLLRETALRNLMGLPPNDGSQFVPVTVPDRTRLQPDWDALLGLAEQNRPDIIELKLILEADRQLLLQAGNQALPRLDAVGLYRWNGLEGEMPIGDRLASQPGQFTDWSMGVNFSVPVGLRQARAGVRKQELLIARDQVFLAQGLHSASHQLTLNVRNLAQYYRQYEAYQVARDAATRNLVQQIAYYRRGVTPLINVLQAITDWGNSINAEAQSLLQYNGELANLARQTGTILEQHGVRFYEERFGAVGPFRSIRCYPARSQPTENVPRYPQGETPSEQSFHLEKPNYNAGERLELPPPEPVSP